MLQRLFRRPARLVLALSLLLAGLVAATPRSLVGLPIPSTPNDFLQPGTQPLTLVAPLQVAQNCAACHGFYDPDQEPYRRWRASMMAQATRDPIFHACLAIAEQDLRFSGELCLRCHTPNGWLDGRSTPTDGSALDFYAGDFDGISCHFCHRLVDPANGPGSPPEDAAILAALGAIPPDAHNGTYVVDPEDRRRGPFDLGPSFFWHDWRESPFHRSSALCGTCHDVSNPAFTRQSDGSYALNAIDAPHPSARKYEQFPIERTYSEWARSEFARGPIEMGGRFGGNRSAVSTCQHCHMPATTGTACFPGLGGEQRDDLPLHDFAGANSWVLRAVRSLYPDSETGLDAAQVDASIARAEAMLRSAADLEAFLAGGELVVRVLNQSGHKLPTGYGEGRRMWIGLRFFDASNALIAERGAYDPATAVLVPDTTIFETKHGLDAAMAVETGLPQGESFHFVLNNEILKDNRIPPRGFTQRAFEAVQAEPVGATYRDEQYWSDSRFAIAAGSARVEVRLWHQTTTKEYIEFLRDENRTNNAGQIAYDQWVLHGRSAPVQMAATSLELAAPPCPTPIPYGRASETALGTRPVLSFAGEARLSTNKLHLRLDRSYGNSFGALLWSAAPESPPFAPRGGSWYLAPPRQVLATFRTDAFGSSGWVRVPITPALVGEERYFQFLVRDPSSSSGAHFSSALHVDFCL